MWYPLLQKHTKLLNLVNILSGQGKVWGRGLISKINWDEFKQLDGTLGISGAGVTWSYLKNVSETIGRVEKMNMDQFKAKLSAMGEENAVRRGNAKAIIISWSAMIGTLINIAAIVAVIWELKKAK